MFSDGLRDNLHDREAGHFICFCCMLFLTPKPVVSTAQRTVYWLYVVSHSETSCTSFLYHSETSCFPWPLQKGVVTATVPSLGHEIQACEIQAWSPKSDLVNHQLFRHLIAGKSESDLVNHQLFTRSNDMVDLEAVHHSMSGVATVDGPTMDAEVVSLVNRTLPPMYAVGGLSHRLPDNWSPKRARKVIKRAGFSTTCRLVQQWS